MLQRGNIQAKDESHVPLLVPMVQVPELGEVGVAAEQDPQKTRVAAEGEALIQLLGSPFVAGAIAGAVDQPQHFARVGERDEQREDP